MLLKSIKRRNRKNNINDFESKNPRELRELVIERISQLPIGDIKFLNLYVEELLEEEEFRFNDFCSLTYYYRMLYKRLDNFEEYKNSVNEQRGRGCFPRDKVRKLLSMKYGVLTIPLNDYSECTQ